MQLLSLVSLFGIKNERVYYGTSGFDFSGKIRLNGEAILLSCFVKVIPFIIDETYRLRVAGLEETKKKIAILENERWREMPELVFQKLKMERQLDTDRLKFISDSADAMPATPIGSKRKVGEDAFFEKKKRGKF
jgi:hypothetical protein